MVERQFFIHYKKNSTTHPLNLQSDKWVGYNTNKIPIIKV